MAENVSVFRIIRVIKRTGTIGKGVGASTAGGRGGGGGGGEGIPFGAISALASGNPYLLALTLGMAGISAAEPYLVFLAGAGPNPGDASVTMADKMHRFILHKAYGQAEGERLYNLQWSNRQIEMDLRTKLP